MPTSINDFQTAVLRYLLPMLPGVDDAPIAHDQHAMSQSVSWIPGAIGLKLRREPGTAHLRLERSQKLFVLDRAVAEAFVDEYVHLDGLGLAAGTDLDLLVGNIPERVVVRIASTRAGLGPGGAAVLRRAIVELTSWASQTYEGMAIASGFGIDEAELPPAPRPSFEEYLALPAAQVIGDGVSTLVVFGSSSTLSNLTVLPEPTGPSTAHTPHAFRRAASWATNQGRVATCLTRRGEVLVFARGNLLFARRRGTWFHANHDGALATWTKIRSAELRRAVYATAIDASFARTGACIAVVQGSNLTQGRIDVTPELVQDKDYTGSADPKGAVLSYLVGGQPFQKLPPEVRQQLTATDGATILAPDGRVLAANAIVTVPGGSDGGGRKAATRALARYGFAVKVSADGKLEAFQGGDPDPVYVGL